MPYSGYRSKILDDTSVMILVACVFVFVSDPRSYWEVNIGWSRTWNWWVKHHLSSTTTKSNFEKKPWNWVTCVNKKQTGKLQVQPPFFSPVGFRGHQYFSREEYYLPKGVSPFLKWWQRLPGKTEILEYPLVSPNIAGWKIHHFQ